MHKKHNLFVTVQTVARWVKLEQPAETIFLTPKLQMGDPAERRRQGWLAKYNLIYIEIKRKLKCINQQMHTGHVHRLGLPYLVGYLLGYLQALSNFYQTISHPKPDTENKQLNHR